MNEPSDTGDLPPEPTEWQLEARRQQERRIIFTAPRATGKSAGLTSLLRFHAETEGEWVSGDTWGHRGHTLIVSDPPDFSEDDQ